MTQLPQRPSPSASTPSLKTPSPKTQAPHTQESGIAAQIAGELGVQPWQVKAAVELLDAGSTLPFIARYRKEATGGLDDTQLRKLEERLIGRWMEESVSLNGSGQADMKLAQLPRERGERALGLMIQIVGGRETPPRRDALEPLAMRVRAEAAFRGATLGGVMIYRKQDILKLQAEPEIAGAAADPVLARARFEAIRALYVGAT